MSAEVWAIISAVIVILIAIATAHRGMRREMNERFGEVNQRIDGLGERIAAVQLEMVERFAEVNERIAAVRTEMIERFGEVNERIAALRTEVVERIAALRGETNERLSRVEGLLEGVGYMLRKRAGKERSDGKPGPVLPQA